MSNGYSTKAIRTYLASRVRTNDGILPDSAPVITAPGLKITARHFDQDRQYLVRCRSLLRPENSRRFHFLSYTQPSYTRD
jgi:hypothetical protein